MFGFIYATRTFDSQVKNIFWLAARNHKGIVISLNGFAEKNTQATKVFSETIREEIALLLMSPLFLFQVSPNNVCLKPSKLLWRFTRKKQTNRNSRTQ